jgi:CRP-like cAMP-binding protein
MVTPPPMREQIELLGAVPLFSLTSKKNLRRIAQQFKTRNVPEGKQLTEQGEYGREFYVVISGSARCDVDGREIRKFGPGSFFGELALLAGGPRSATIIAETPMELLVLDRRDFTILVRVVPDVAVNMLASLAARLQEADHQVTN